MAEWIFSGAKGVITSVVTFLVATGVVLPGPGVTPIIPPQTAIVEAPATPAPYVAGVPATETNLPPVTPGLLPAANLSPATSTPPTKTIATKKDPAPTPAKTPTSSAPLAPAKSPVIAMTAQSFLDATTLSFKERRDGPYEPVLVTSIGNGQTLRWGLNDEKIGGSNGVPQFTDSISCDPIPISPDPGDLDQNPYFPVRTPYTCNVSLTPTNGNDLTAHTKKFTGQTDPGALIVTPQSSMNTVLQNDRNSGGFTFNNQDSQPVNVTGVTFDDSYLALVTADTPLILRFITDDNADPTLYQHHMESIPEDPPGSLAHAESGASVSIPFTIPALSQRFLTVQALGVRKMLISGTNPDVSVTLRGITTDRSDVKTKIMSPTIAWTCVVVIGGYDPNATSGPFATGNACRN